MQNHAQEHLTTNCACQARAAKSSIDDRVRIALQSSCRGWPPSKVRKTCGSGSERPHHWGAPGPPSGSDDGPCRPRNGMHWLRPRLQVAWSSSRRGVLCDPTDWARIDSAGRVRNLKAHDASTGDTEWQHEGWPNAFNDLALLQLTHHGAVQVLCFAHHRLRATDAPLLRHEAFRARRRRLHMGRRGSVSANGYG